MAGLKLDFSAIRELGKEIAGTTETRQQTKKAVVREITDGGAVVEIAGSGVLTPVESSAATYNIGDVVTVSNRGGKLHIDGDVSAPSVGAGYVRKTVQPVVQAVAEAAQTAANGVKAGADAQKVADEAKAAAAATNQHFWTDTNGMHVTEQTQEDWQTAPDGGNILINSLGLLLRKALNNLVSVTASAVAFFDGSGNEAANITARFGADGAQIGKTGAPHTVIAASGTDFYGKADGSVRLAHIGYDSGNAESGTATAPYFTFGTRATYSFLRPEFDASIGNYSTTEGGTLIASGAYSHCEGGNSEAHGYGSHAEGDTTFAIGRASHAEGYRTFVRGDYAHANGNRTNAGYESQTVIGRYNDNQSDNAFEIGNGSNGSRSNAFAVDWDGNVDAAGKVNNHAARKTLWTGEFSSGSLVVDGLDQYSLVEVTFRGIATHATCWLSGSGTRAYLRGSNTYVSASRIIDYIVGLDASINDGYVTLSWVNCKERNMLISNQTITISDIIITSIIGVL